MHDEYTHFLVRGRCTRRAASFELSWHIDFLLGNLYKKHMFDKQIKPDLEEVFGGCTEELAEVGDVRIALADAEHDPWFFLRTKKKVTKGCPLINDQVEVNKLSFSVRGQGQNTEEREPVFLQTSGKHCELCSKSLGSCADREGWRVRPCQEARLVRKETNSARAKIPESSEVPLHGRTSCARVCASVPHHCGEEQLRANGQATLASTHQ